VAIADRAEIAAMLAAAGLAERDLPADVAARLGWPTSRPGRPCRPVRSFQRKNNAKQLI
jgi:hypothetical protein